jgi:hypothetical protein
MIPGLFYYNPDAVKPQVQTVRADVCIYGGTSAGVAAAWQLAKMGKKAVIVAPEGNLGGLSSSGLGMTDVGNKDAIGGLSHEFYKRVGAKYNKAEEWRFEPKVAEAVFKEIVAETQTPVYFRHFLKSVRKNNARLVSLTTEGGLTVEAKAFIDATYEGDLLAKAGVSYHVGREDNKVYGETLNGVQVHKTHQFELPVDPYIVEGDANSGLLPGISPEPLAPIGSGDKKVQAYNFRLCLTTDPANRIAYAKPEGYNPQEYELLRRYLKAGWRTSEIFRKFDTIQNSFKSDGQPATATTLTRADIANAPSFVFKLKNAGGPLTKWLKEQFPAPLQEQLNAYKQGDTPSDDLVAAVVAELNRLITNESLYSDERFSRTTLAADLKTRARANLTGDERAKINRQLLEAAYDEIGSRYLKCDKNNHGAVSTDFIGRNYLWPEADYATREKIFQEHVTYQRGLMWFLGNDEAVPEDVRRRWNQWGLCKDEFQATGGWPHQLYVREARRMISDYVMTEQDCKGQRKCEDPVGLASYNMDSHNCQRFVKDGKVMNEGDVQIGVKPYPLSYRSIVPRKAECENLLVPVCASTSHIAYGSIRMEPVFMILAQSAATAAALSLDAGSAVQDVPYEQLKARLLTDGQVLEWKK